MCQSRPAGGGVRGSRQRFVKDPYHKDQFTYDEQSDRLYVSTGGRHGSRSSAYSMRTESHVRLYRQLPAPSVRHVSSLRSVYKSPRRLGEVWP